MKRSWIPSLAKVLTLALTISSAPAWACGPGGCRTADYADQPSVQQNLPRDDSAAEVVPAIDGVVAGDEAVNELPAGAKRAIRLAAAKGERTYYVEAATSTAAPIVARTVAASQTSAASRPANVGPTAPAAGSLSFSDRMAQVFAVRQHLAVQTARLEAKMNELNRWDAPAQEKFRQAFGSVDENLRQRVAKAIQAQIDRNRQTVAALSEGVNFEFYMRSKKK
jgi:hypothetical protein